MTEPTTNGASPDDVLAEIRKLREQPALVSGPVQVDTFTTVDGFEDLDAFFDDHLELPIRGKLYRIPPADAELGLLCSRLVMAGTQVANSGKVADRTATELNEEGAKLDDEEEADIYRRLLGSVQDEMIADGLDWQRIQHVGSTALIWTALGKSAALNFWKSGARPKVPGPPPPAAPQDHKQKRKGTAKSGRQGSPVGTTHQRDATPADTGGTTFSDTGG